MKVNIFISWSGNYSRAVAECLHSWLCRAIIFSRPYYSGNDIVKGARWDIEISKLLESSNIGLLLITPDNLNSNWIAFEAGALSRKIDQSRVCPILFNMKASDLTGPLVQFQLALFNKEDMFKVVQMINLEAGELMLTNEVLKEIFEQWWPALESGIAKIPYSKETEAPGRDINEISIEILDRLREINRSENICIHYVNKANTLTGKLLGVFEKLVFRIQAIPNDSYYDLDVLLLELLLPVHSFILNTQRSPCPLEESEFILLQQKFKALERIVFAMNKISNE